MYTLYTALFSLHTALLSIYTIHTALFFLYTLHTPLFSLYTPHTTLSLVQCVVNVTAYYAAQITKTGPHTELSIYDCSGQYDVYSINHALHSVGHFKLIVHMLHCALHFFNCSTLCTTYCTQ